MTKLDSAYPPHLRACPVGNVPLPAPIIAAVLDGDATATVRGLNGRHRALE